MQMQGVLEQVETVQARSFASAAASVAATVVYVDDVTALLTASGDCTVDIDGVQYTATPDDGDNSLALSPALSVAVAEGDPVTLVPATDVKWAWVSVPSDDDMGDLIQCRVPLNMVALKQLQDGPKVDDERVAVVIETQPEPVVVNFPNGPTTHDASTTPIIVRNSDGEAVVIGGDGFTAYTDDALLLRTRDLTSAGTPSDLVASGSTYFYVLLPSGYVRYPYDGSPPALVVSGPIADVCTNGTYTFAVDSSADIAKYDVAFSPVAGGFPIAGTFSKVTADGTNVFAIDSAADIRKYAASTGTQNVSGFPIAGTFTDLTVSDTHLYLIQSGDIYKYDKVTGVQDTNGFPIVGTFTSPACDESYVYAIESGGIRRFSLIDGVEQITNSFPIAGSATAVATGDAPFLVSVTGSVISVYNNASGVESFRINSATGSIAAAVADIDRLVGKQIDVSPEVSRLDINGPTAISGQTSAPLLGHSDQKTLTTSASPTSTTNVTMPELDMSVTVGSTSDVVWVDCDAEVTITVNSTINLIELLVDGVAQTKQLRTRISAANLNVAGYKKWRLTGLSPGAHTLTFRTRNTAGSTGAAVVGAGLTGASYWTST